MAQPPSSPEVSVVLAADDPAALARFYGAVLGSEPQPGLGPQHWRVPLPGGGLLEIYAPARARPVPRGRARLGLCLRLPGGAAALEACLAEARARGAQPLEPPRREPFGMEAWLLDPEGNGLLLLAPSPMTLPLDSMQQLASACAACRRCGLADGRLQVVVGRGNPRARLLLIGEAPGAQEDLEGLPFVGRSGQLLDRLLHSAGIDSNRDTYICNVVKCRPPDNRKPSAAELAACRPWLEQQIALLDAPLVLLVGATALQGVLGIKGGITSLRGQWRPWQGRWLMPILHPSYLLRNPSERPGSPKALTLDDLRQVRERLAQLPAPL